MQRIGLQELPILSKLPPTKTKLRRKLQIVCQAILRPPIPWSKTHGEEGVLSQSWISWFVVVVLSGINSEQPRHQLWWRFQHSDCLMMTTTKVTVNWMPIPFDPMKTSWFSATKLKTLLFLMAVASATFLATIVWLQRVTCHGIWNEMHCTCNKEAFEIFTS